MSNPPKTPWTIGTKDNYVTYILSNDGRTDDVDPEWTVAIVNNCMGSESEANVRLIVTSPKMLAVLQAIDSAARESQTIIGFASKAFKLLKQIREVISEATGDNQ